MNASIKSIAIVNGPNLNLTGSRERDIYGDQGFDNLLSSLREEFPGIAFDYYQSNIEGDLINFLHKLDGLGGGIILNAGGYTHTSIALGDAVRAISCPVVEVHLSNIFSREDYRHVSFIGAAAKGVIGGFGLDSYRLATRYLLEMHGKE